MAREDSHPQPNVLAASRGIDLSPRFWLLLGLTGIGAGLGGGVLMLLLHWVQHTVWSYHAGEFDDAVARASPLTRILVAGLAGVLGAVGLTVLRFARGGHGGELSVAIWFEAGEMPLLRTLGRSVLSIVIVGLGTALGREGALKQTGGLIASKLAALAKLSPPQRRLLTACGAGAGVAVAYNIPLGGALLALEILLGSITLPSALPAIACAMLATAVSWLLLPMRPTYEIPLYNLSLVQVAWALLAGPLIGAAAVGYVRLIALADRDRPRAPWLRFAEPIVAMLMLGAAAIAFPQLLGNGKDVVQKTFSEQLGPVWLVMALVVLRPLATSLCLTSGLPGGLFTPTLTLGALLGDVLGRGWALIAPVQSNALGAYAVVGGAAMLAAATQGPVSAVVIALELGRHLDLLIVPMGIAVAGAMLVMRLSGSPSIYAARLRAGAEPPAPPAAEEAGPLSSRVRTDVATVSAAAHAAAALGQLLLEERGRGRPVYVLDRGRRLIGRLSPSRLAHREGLRPLELLTAGDLAEPVEAFTRGCEPEAIEARLGRPGLVEIPVVQPKSGALIGVLRPGDAGG